MKCPVAPGSFRSGGDDVQPGTGGKQDDPRGAIALARMNWLHSKYEIVSSTPPLRIRRHILTVNLLEQRRLPLYARPVRPGATCKQYFPAGQAKA